MSALCAQHVSPNEKLNTLNKKYEEPFGAIDFPSIAANILAFVRAGFLIRHMQESVFVEWKENEGADWEGGVRELGG